MEAAESQPLPPTLGDVLESLGQNVDLGAAPPDRLIIMKATDQLFACRQYEIDGGEYEGIILSFD